MAALLNNRLDFIKCAWRSKVKIKYANYRSKIVSVIVVSNAAILKTTLFVQVNYLFEPYLAYPIVIHLTINCQLMSFIRSEVNSFILILSYLTFKKVI